MENHRNIAQYSVNSGRYLNRYFPSEGLLKHNYYNPLSTSYADKKEGFFLYFFLLKRLKGSDVFISGVMCKGMKDELLMKPDDIPLAQIICED